MAEIDVADYLPFPLLKILLSSLFDVGGSVDITLISHGTLITGTAVSPHTWMRELAAVSRRMLSPESQGGEEILKTIEVVADDAEQPGFVSVLREMF